MKHIVHIALIAVLMATAAFSLEAQETVAAHEKMLPFPLDTIDNQVFYRYTPEKSMGLYRISKIFKVSQDDIVLHNPQLQNRGPQLGEMLLIPYKVIERQETKTEMLQPEQAAADTIRPISQDSVLSSVVDTLPVVDTAAVQIPYIKSIDTLRSLVAVDTLRIAVILPIRADAAERDDNDDRFFDFYMGVLLAVKQAVDDGIRIQVHIYDVERQDRQLQKVLSDPFFHHADAVIGPAYMHQVELLSPVVQEDSMFMLVPFTPYVPSLQSNPFILQFNPTDEAEADALADYIEKRENDINIVIIDAKEEDIPQSIRLLRNKLKQTKHQIHTATIHQILADSLFTSLNDSAENVILFNTEKYGNLQVLMPHLVLANQKNLLTLISRYSWQKDNIGLGQIYTSVFNEEIYSSQDSTGYAEYAAMWQHYFPFSQSLSKPRYDLLGFDLARHLLLILQTLQEADDPTYLHYLLTRHYKGLQSDISYKRYSETGGYINHGIKIFTK